MSRRCERPGCSAAAAVAYGFAAPRQLAWLAGLDQDRNAAGALCEAHAGAMVLPRGWWLDDRRTDEPTLFRSPEHRPAIAVPHHGVSDDQRRRRVEARRAHELVVGEQLALDADVVPPCDEPPPAAADPPEPDSSEPVESVEPAADSEVPSAPVEPWMPAFDVTDDLGGLLDASTPLLARAFGRPRRSTTPPADRG